MISEERKIRLQKEIKKLQAYETIQNEMGRTIAAVNFKQPDQVLAHFALEYADVSVECADEGVFQGKKAVTAFIREHLGRTPLKGEMTDIQLTTPIIEVAGDLETAKALWWCPGAGSIVKEETEPQAVWLWGMLGVDFICVEEEWKIWHLHYFRYIKCSYEKGWVEDISMINRPNTPLHPLAKPTTYHNPYSPLSIREGLPACPRPYETYEGGPEWMLNRDKTI